MGFNFFVNKSVLIPRPDTETLVKYALKAMPNKTIKYRCLDVCTGSGCIAISLALMRPNIVIDAIDNSKPALKVLKYNIKYFNLEHRIRSIHNNLLYSYIINKKLNLIIANPPYLTQKEYNSLTPNIKNYEPKQALVNNKYDPLLVHKILIRDSYAYLLNKGILILEFGYNQKNKLIKIHRGKFKNQNFLLIILEFLVFVYFKNNYTRKI
jgi:HemK-like putative methylase